MPNSRCWALVLLAIVLFPAGAAWAAGLESVKFVVTMVGQAGTDSSISGTVTIKGPSGDARFKTAVLTPPGTAFGSCDAATGACTLTVPSSSISALPPGTATNFLLEIDKALETAITATIPYTPPTSPKISSPVDETVDDTPILPGLAEVKFTACPTSACDSTHGKLTKLGVGTPLADEDVLPDGSAVWKPLTTGPVEFPAQSDLTATIEHKVDRTEQRTATGDSDGFTFQNVSTHSDTVGFKTGIAPPVGTFCIDVNGGAGDPEKRCRDVEEPAAGILDTSVPDLAPIVSTAAGIPFQYSLKLAPNGRLSGIAEADLDGIPSPDFEVPADLSGRLRGKNGLLRQTIRTRFDATSDTKIRVRIREEANLATLVGVANLEWLVGQKTRGKDGGVRLSEDTTSTRTTDAALTGWRLEFTLPGSGGPTSGTLLLANGVSVALVGTQSFDVASGLSKLKLASEGAVRGVLIRIKKLEIVNNEDITAGAVRFRAFGQGSSLTIP